MDLKSWRRAFVDALKSLNTAHIVIENSMNPYHFTWIYRNHLNKLENRTQPVYLLRLSWNTLITTGRWGKLWPADAGPEGGDYLSSCELEQFLESQRKKTHQNQSPKMDLKTEIKVKSVYSLASKIEQLKLIFFL